MPPIGIGIKFSKAVMRNTAVAQEFQSALSKPFSDLARLRAEILELRAEIERASVTPEVMSQPGGIQAYWQRFKTWFSSSSRAAEPVTPAAPTPAPRAAEPVAAPAEAPMDRAANRLTEMETDIDSIQSRLPYMTGIKIKRAFSLESVGQEYAQVRSPLVMGVKHPTVKATFPVRSDVPIPAYAERVQNFAVRFNRAMTERRSPFVSPRLAVRTGLSPEAALQGYEGFYNAFQRPLRLEHPAVTAGGTRHQLAADLAQEAVHTKVLQTGQFRVQVKHNPALGPVTVKIPMTPGHTPSRHLENGLSKAVRLHQALQPDLSVERHLSPKMLRTNAVTRRINLNKLPIFEQALAILSSPEIQERLQDLTTQGVEVKVLRDMTFRVLRRNAKGEVAKEYRLSVRPGEGMRQFIERGMEKAEEKARKPLPEKPSFLRQLRNEFRPLKKAFTDL